MRQVLRVLTVVATAGLFIQFGCKDSGTRSENGQWESLGFEDKLALRLVLAEPYLYVCAGSDGLWRRNVRQSGANWENLGLADTSLGKYINRGVRDVLIHRDNPDWILVAYQPHQATDHGVYRSLDGATSWAPADSGMEFIEDGITTYKRLRRFVAYPTYILGGGDWVCLTTNFGTYWNRIPTARGIGGDVLAKHPREHNTVWFGGEGLLFQPLLSFSGDGGFTWTGINLYRHGVPVDNAVYSIAFDPIDTNIVYVGMQGAIIKTTDGGQSWIVPLVTNPRGEFFRAILSDPRNPSHLWAAGGPDLIETWDSGRSWREVRSPIPRDTKVFDMLWDDRRGETYIATLRGVYRFKP